MTGPRSEGDGAMNPQNATPAKRKKWPLWAKGLLVASLALNVLVMGLFAGHMLKKRDARVMGSQQLSWILKFVPEERRDFTKAHFKQFRGELRAARRAQRETMDRILDTIRTEPFSAEDLQAAMNARLETRS